MRIAVIGGGASGLMVGLHAAWQGAEVTLIERNATLGRKLLVTGSGRCNLTNAQLAPDRYTCADSAWLGGLLKSFGLTELLKDLKSLGIPTYPTWDGWYYPLSESAHSVVDAFTHAIEEAGIILQLSNQVVDITPEKRGFAVAQMKNGTTHIDSFSKVIVAAGGKAYPTLGSTGELFPTLEKLGHTVIPIQPALAPVLAELDGLKPLEGLRMDIGVALLQGTTTLATSAGNVIFTPWGLNGPAVMDLSHQIPENPGDSHRLSLNLLHFVEEEFNGLLEEKRATPFPAGLLLSAFFAPRAAECLLKLCGIHQETCLKDLDDETIHSLVSRLKATSLKVRGVRGYAYCQVSSGGVQVSEVNPTSLESRVLPGLHLTGETLDVVGPCGGYNLHFAFASGALAGKAAGSK